MANIMCNEICFWFVANTFQAHAFNCIYLNLCLFCAKMHSISVQSINLLYIKFVIISFLIFPTKSKMTFKIICFIQKMYTLIKYVYFFLLLVVGTTHV